MMDQANSETLVALFQRQVAENAGRVALHVPSKSGFRSLTWKQIYRDVLRVAATLRHLGVAPGDRVVQVSENRYDWIIADLAMQHIQAVDVAVHSVLSGPQIAYQIIDSEAKVVLISTEDQALKLIQPSVKLPENIHYLSYDPCSVEIGAKAVPKLFQLALTMSGPAVMQIHDEAQQKIDPDRLVSILYTSGTTGEPKGVMLTHRNLASNAVTAVECFGMRSDELKLCWLPLSHIFARTCDLYTWMVAGSELALARGRETVLEDCASFRPHLLSGVPYFYEKVWRHLRDDVPADKPDCLKDIFGGRIRACVAGGAALPVHVNEFFIQQGVALLQGYGLTESSPVITMSTETSYKIGTVGKPITGIEVRIADDGEILTKGPHVMCGYWKNPDATKESVRDGWLHTGDIGEFDEDGFLQITGRKKELIVTASGKNVAPVLLESLLSDDPLISQAMVIGDGRKFLTALIVPDQARLGEELQRMNVFPSDAEKLSNPAVLALYEERIQSKLVDLAPYEQVGRFVLISDSFSLEREELTPTLKLRREVIANHYADLIEAMYKEA